MDRRLSPREVLAVTFVVSFCSIVYEFLVAKALVDLTGETVLWQSVTIGVYVGALGLGTWMCDRRSHADPLRTLLRVELGLSVAGGLSILAVHLGHLVYRAEFYDFFEKSARVQAGRGTGFDDPLVVFATSAQLVTVVVGVLSGFEVPLLLDRYQASSGRDGTSKVLGWSYTGTLAGALVFGLVLMPRTDLPVAAVLTGGLNLLVCVLLALRRAAGPSPGSLGRSLALSGAAAALLGGAAVAGGPVEAFVWKAFYYNFPSPVGLAELPAKLRAKPDPRRIRTPYQSLDVVWDEHMKSRPELGLVDVTLYINGHFQLSALNERSYHEWLVHVPVLTTGKVPSRALVLGAGDGLLARELVRYGPPLAEVVMVELDPEMIRLATEDPTFRELNGRALEDPRVRVVPGDALSYVRETDRTFDAVWLDFPYPYDYDLAKLFSVEFFRFVRARLEPGGFLAFDYPLLHERFGDTGRRMNSVLLSTLAAAGFEGRFPYGDEDETFVLATADARPLSFEMRDLGFPLETLDGAVLASLRDRPYPHEIDSGRVNSIFHPRLFELRDLRF